MFYCPFIILKVYNSLGQEIKTLTSQWLGKGFYTYPFVGNTYPEGIYYYTLQCRQGMETKSMLLIKNR